MAKDKEGNKNSSLYQLAAKKADAKNSATSAKVRKNYQADRAAGRQPMLSEEKRVTPKEEYLKNFSFKKGNLNEEYLGAKAYANKKAGQSEAAKKKIRGRIAGKKN